MSDTEDSDLLAGRNPVREVLEDAGSVDKVWLQNNVDTRFAAEIRSLARSASVPVQVVPQRRLEHMVPGVNHQGVIARLSAVTYRDLDEVLSEVAPTREDVQRDKPLFVLLDGIQDPHNLGAILRSAVAAGADGIIVPSRGAAPINAAALKTSAGTARMIPIARVNNPTDALGQMKERGYWVAGAAGDGEETVWTMDWDRALVLVIGSEGDGMRRPVAKACDYRVRIPMRGAVDSLNASVAAGVLLFAAIRDRV